MLDFVSDGLGFVPVFTTFFIGIFTVVLLYRFSTRNHGYFKEKGIPYATPYPFVGTLVQTITDFTNSEIKRHQTLGPIFGHFDGNQLLLSVGSPELLRDVLIKDFHLFTSRRDFRFGDEIMDSMMSVIQGEDWKRVRTIVTPTFTTGKIRRMQGIFNECAKTLTKNFLNVEGQDIEVKRFYGTFTMDIIASAAFSTKIDSHNNPDNPFVSTARKIFSKQFSWRFLLFLMAPKLMKFFHIPVFDPNNMGFFIKATKQIIEERRKTGQTRNDFLQLLLDTAEDVAKEQKWDVPEATSESDMVNNYGDEPNINHHVFKNAMSVKKNLTMNELIAQCVIFFVAGYDTTASTLSFCSYQLALNPDIQEKARDEVDSVIKEFGGEVTYEAVQQMKYLDNLISETLRILPPAARTERVSETDYKLGDTGITIPKGMIVTVPVYALHHDPKHFPEPEKFNPDRFTPEEKAKRDQFAYLPFGAGPRNCVGMRFALMEIKVCLAHILATFKITKSPKTQIPLDFYLGQGLLQARKITLRMEKREDSPLKK